MDALAKLRATTHAWFDRVALRSPARLALGSFALVIGVFTALLSIPAATASGVRAPFIDALFTAVSAVCVTGLVTVDTATYWSPLGLTIIAAAIKTGGLGIMTVASLVGLAVSRRLGLSQRLLTAGEARASGLGDLRSLLRTVLVVSLAVELSIAAVLVPRLLTADYGIGRSFGYSVFYGISAFNNAGFTPDPDGLTPFTSDLWMLVPIGLGVLIGSLGYPVYLTLVRAWRTPRRWPLHTKITLLVTVALTVISTVMVALLEWTNPRTLGDGSTARSIGDALFHSINLRSGGFSTMEVAEARPTTWLLDSVLMFVGGGSGSTAGGIRVTTLAVLLLAIWAEARGRRDLEAYGKRIGTTVVRAAVAVTLVGLAVVIIGAGVLMWQTGHSLERTLHEAVSAFATAGLSTGITHTLGADAKITLIVLMYVGRVGTLTVAAALALHQQRRVIRYPSERLIIG